MPYLCPMQARLRSVIFNCLTFFLPWMLQAALPAVVNGVFGSALTPLSERSLHGGTSPALISGDLTLTKQEILPCPVGILPSILTLTKQETGYTDEDEEPGAAIGCVPLPLELPLYSSLPDCGVANKKSNDTQPGLSKTNMLVGQDSPESLIESDERGVDLIREVQFGVTTTSSANAVMVSFVVKYSHYF